MKLEQFLAKRKEKSKKEKGQKKNFKRCCRVSSLQAFNWIMLFVCGYF
jgi:hypothetical protein